MSVVKRMLKNAQTSKPVILQLTAMVDMFTILVVFLLKSMSASSIKPPPEDLKLPMAYAAEEPKEALLIQVSPNYISINEKKLVTLKAGKLEVKDVAKNDLYLIPELEKKLLEEAEISKRVETETKGLVKFKGTVFIEFDKTLEYSTVKRVLYTSSVAGYGDLKLATINGAE
jgi:biopolymer transport protein ExbD